MTRKHPKIEIATPEDVARYAPNEPGSPPAESQVGPSGDAAVAPTAPPGDAGPGAMPGPADLPEATAKEIESLRAELEQWKDKCLRARAELANYQRRVEQERAELIKYANAEFARSLLPIIDDLERALGHVGGPDADGNAVVHALRLIHEKFVKTLAQQQVEPIEAAGRPFDPALHEALMQQASDAHAEPTVLQELEKGYRMHERVLRPAKVIVSKPPSEE